jgi:hypothetical protein
MGHMRRVLIALLSLAALGRPLAAQRGKLAPDSVTRQAITEFVTNVRDMAASRIVTPAAHIPVGGMLDSAGNVASVVGAGPEPTDTPDSVLTAFRQLLGAGARRQGARAIALGYLTHRTPPSGKAPLDVVVVEVEHVNGYRADMIFPYTRNEFGEPVFGDAFKGAGTLTTLSGRKAATRGRR